jgi:hypothetical protein
MTQRRIAYLTGRSFRGALTPPDAVPAFETAEFALVRDAGRRLGISFEPTYWNDPHLPQKGFEGAVVRSCWDYIDHCDRFLNCLDAHEEAGLRIFNLPRVLRWNARKRYLADLQKAGVPVIETKWIERAEPRLVAQAFEDLDAAELVLKPQVGASSRETLRLKRNAWSDMDLALGPQGPAMLQPFLPMVETDGETSLMYFGGTLSHVVRKRPGAGRWYANDQHTRIELAAPPEGAAEIAEACLRAAPGPNLYARIDLIAAAPGDWRLIELELIEPYFYLDTAPQGAGHFVRALTDALRV